MCLCVIVGGYRLCALASELQRSYSSVSVCAVLVRGYRLCALASELQRSYSSVSVCDGERLQAVCFSLRAPERLLWCVCLRAMVTAEQVKQVNLDDVTGCMSHRLNIHPAQRGLSGHWHGASGRAGKEQNVSKQW